MKKFQWTNEDFQAWKSRHKILRSYQEEVVSKIEKLKEDFDVDCYGELHYGDKNYPLYRIMTKNYDSSKKNVLITGGVHGYETSGVQGALMFLAEKAKEWQKNFNLVVFPCISPWGYETINRWNPDAIDPNRSFIENSDSKECAAVYESLKELGLDFHAHFDLHETTDTDNTVFRPDLEKRDGIPQDLWEIPDGFYTVGDSSRDEIEFQKAIIESVSKVTHIAPSDEQGMIIGEPTKAPGIINYDVKKLNLCAGLTNAKYVTTTEVYPDSPKVDDDECNRAQVAAVDGGLGYILSKLSS
ncbi:M14 family metallocarboxypeptidase [Halobacteriovorax sp. GB3]|uniref:M14 family metallopeptidase n=1 Tax=Halobacteriovorax sp. GB3 TaxID=2719615 RepID=UPI002362FD82|nr:M14 family metallocarboxypeptidase [Halobacteriovorax sp. GB3]MDD0851630.1 M14 family metallocarboxypeptidase [Halobacteriovorax sp. GB3]